MNTKFKIKTFFITVIMWRLLQLTNAFAFSVTIHYTNVFMRQSPFVDGLLTGGVFICIIAVCEKQIPKKYVTQSKKTLVNENKITKIDYKH